MKILTDNKDILDKIAKILIEKEKISGNQMIDLIK
jgi:ATP-dependent Zn protease